MTDSTNAYATVLYRKSAGMSMKVLTKHFATEAQFDKFFEKVDAGDFEIVETRVYSD